MTEAMTISSLRVSRCSLHALCIYPCGTAQLNTIWRLNILWEITRRAWFSLTCEKYIHSVKRWDKWSESEVQSLRSGLRHAKAPVGDPCYCLSVKASQFFYSDMVFFIVIRSRDMTGCGYGIFCKEISTCWSYVSALMITLSNKCTCRHDMLTSILGTGSRRPIETLSF